MLTICICKYLWYTFSFQKRFSNFIASLYNLLINITALDSSLSNKAMTLSQQEREALKKRGEVAQLRSEDGLFAHTEVWLPELAKVLWTKVFIPSAAPFSLLIAWKFPILHNSQFYRLAWKSLGASPRDCHAIITWIPLKLLIFIHCHLRVLVHAQGGVAPSKGFLLSLGKFHASVML